MKKLKVNKTLFLQEIKFIGSYNFDVYKEIRIIINQDILRNLSNNIIINLK